LGTDRERELVVMRDESRSQSSILSRTFLRNFQVVRTSIRAVGCWLGAPNSSRTQGDTPRTLSGTPAVVFGKGPSTVVLPLFGGRGTESTAPGTSNTDPDEATDTGMGRMIRCRDRGKWEE